MHFDRQRWSTCKAFGTGFVDCRPLRREEFIKRTCVESFKDLRCYATKYKYIIFILPLYYFNIYYVLYTK